MVSLVLHDSELIGIYCACEFKARSRTSTSPTRPVHVKTSQTF